VPRKEPRPVVAPFAISSRFLGPGQTHKIRSVPLRPSGRPRAYADRGKSLDHGAASRTSPATRNLGVLLLGREGLVVRVVKDLRIWRGPLSPSLRSPPEGRSRGGRLRGMLDTP
jgi:hypothetical protein